MADDNDPEITKVMEKDVFMVEKVPLKLIRAKGNYNTEPRKLQVSKVYMDDIGVHCCRRERYVTRKLEKVEFKMGAYVSYSHPGWTHTMENNHRLTTNEQVFCDERGNNIKLKFLRREPKSAAAI